MKEGPPDLCLCLAVARVMPVLQEWPRTGMLHSYVVALYALAISRRDCAMDQGRLAGSCSR